MRVHYTQHADMVLRGRRLRVRRVDEAALARRAMERAARTGEPAISFAHGGGVANKYGYPAETEGVVAVAFPSEDVVLFASRLPANKVTLSGVLAHAVGEWARPVADGRYSKDMKEAYRLFVIATARGIKDATQAPVKTEQQQQQEATS